MTSFAAVDAPDSHEVDSQQYAKAFLDIIPTLMRTGCCCGAHSVPR
jgi:hypothetical protein